MNKLKGILLPLLIVFLSAGCSRAGKASLSAKSTDLKSTTITGHMEEKISDGKNIIYCSTFQLAWNEFKDNITKGDIHLQNETPLVKYLNKGLSTKKDLSEDSFIAMVGMKKDDILNKINSELKRKFKNEAPVVRENMNREDDILAYSFLLKDLQFNKEFENLKGYMTFKNKKVQSFGIKKYESKNEEMGKQVEVRYYKEEPGNYDNREFIVGLKSKNSTDEIILAAVQPKENLLDTYKYADSLMKSRAPGKLNSSDKLAIPKFDFDITHTYSELLDKNLTNKGFEGYRFVKAIQNTRFKIDEKGVKLKSEARLFATKGEAPISRTMVFDSPFLLFMKEKDAEYPYHIMWVDNPEILIKE